MHGGLPVGGVVELVGTACSGRTTVALAYMAAITQASGVVAWIDVADAVDPESVAACGVDLERLLWVRCGPGVPIPLPTPEGRQGASLPVSCETSQQRHTGGGSPYSRSEGRDMPQAVSALLKAHGGLYDKQMRREKRALGTPGAPNRSVTNRSENREEQVNSDRLPPRRGDNLALEPRCAEPQPRRVASIPSGERFPVAGPPAFRSARSAQPPWPALDQALRAADLLLQGGGFSAIVLDLGGTPPEVAWRIPLATWFRFRAACERTRSSLVLLTQHPCTRSSAELVVRLQTGDMEVDSRVMTGIRYQATTERSRTHGNDVKVVSMRKPPQAEHAGGWSAETTWAQTK